MSVPGRGRHPEAAPRSASDEPLVSRRAFLGQLAIVGGGTLALSACRKPAREVIEGPDGLSLTGAELAICTAACDRVLPADDEPGAVQLGVPQYIDRRLARPGRRALEAKRKFRRGLAQLSEWSQKHRRRRFTALDPDAQDEMLASLAAEGGPEGYEFVQRLMRLTLEGSFCDPSYGGNKDGAGWKIIGFPAQNAQCR